MIEARQHRPLSLIRVLDLSQTVAGQFCGRLFADHGADVVLVEPSHGSATRRLPPFVGSGPDSTRSSLFWHLNLGKRSIGADESDDGAVAALARETDVVIVDAASRLDAAPTDGPAVVCDVTPFGREGSLADWRGNELVYQALSGVMYENGLAGRPPLYGVGHRASYAAGMIAYVECLATLLARDDRQRRIDVSIAEVAASMSFCRATQYAYNRVVEDRDSRTTPRAIVRCADGWVSVFIYDHRWRQSCRALGLDDLVDDPRFVDEATRLRNWDDFVAELEKRLLRRTVDEVLVAGQSEKAVVAQALSPADLVRDPQLLARGFWDWSAAPEGLPRLGPMFRFGVTVQERPGDAPAAPAAAAGTAWVSPGVRSDGGTRHAKSRPLEGLRVVDLTTAWSGPMATRLLASLGATVDKIEGPGRIDDWRGPATGGLRSRYPDRDPGERPYDRCFQFNTQNHDKRGLALDLKTEAGKELLLEMCRSADVLAANFSSGTLDRMGIGWDVVSRINPRLVLLEMPAYGSDGPLGHFVGLGPSMELMSGMGMLIGYGDGRPLTTGPAYLDPIGGFNAAAAILTALMARELTGLGQHVEMAQREAAMHWIGEEIVHATVTGSARTPDGNRHPSYAPHDAFPCLGFDEWVAIAAESDDEFRALAFHMELHDLLDDPSFATAAGRKEHEQRLSERIAGWTRERDKHEIAEGLQAAGVPAAPVCNASDLVGSRFLRERGLLRSLDHPVTGAHRYQGVPLHICGWDLTPRTPAPTFGKHTAQILRELGLADRKIDLLEQQRVIATAPRGNAGAPSRAGAAARRQSLAAAGGGLTIAAWGAEDAAPILFVHGGAEDSGAWTRQTAGPLVDEFRVVTFELQGQDTPSAEHVAAILDQLALDRPVVVASTAGTAVVTEFVSRSGQAALAGVCFVDPAIARDSAEVAGVSGRHRAAGAAAAKTSGAALLEPDAGAPAAADRPPTLEIPVLLACRGSARSDSATRVRRLWPHARASYYEDCDGPPFREEPQRFDLELADFVSRANRDRYSRKGSQDR